MRELTETELDFVSGATGNTTECVLLYDIICTGELDEPADCRVVYMYAC
jgi:hypothetical protein